jgi:hypothetical protein
MVKYSVIESIKKEKGKTAIIQIDEGKYKGLTFRLGDSPVPGDDPTEASNIMFEVFLESFEEFGTQEELESDEELNETVSDIVTDILVGVIDIAKGELEND